MMSEAVRLMMLEQLRAEVDPDDRVWSKLAEAIALALRVITRMAEVRALTVASTVTPDVMR
jgi:hypothetical protein